MITHKLLKKKQKCYIHKIFFLFTIYLLVIYVSNINAQDESLPDNISEKTIIDINNTDGQWIQLFNGKDINDWIVKINHHDMGDNYRDTFRV